MAVGVGGAVAVVGKAVGLRPGVLAVPAGPLGVVALRNAGVLVDGADIVGVPRVLMRGLEDVPGVGGGRGVGEAGVVVDDLVQRRVERGPAETDRGVVVPGGGLGSYNLNRWQLPYCEKTSFVLGLSLRFNKWATK